MTSGVPEESDIDIPGAEIGALAWGSPEDRPVLGLHGWLDNAATWHRVGPLLEGMRLVAVDLPGHGESSHHAAGQMYHFVDWIPVIFDIADALGWEEFSVLGHSMGAAAALMAAGTLPERIDRMVLVDGLGPWTTPAAETPEQLAEGIAERKTLIAKEKRRFEDIDQACDVLSEIYHAPPDVLRPMVERGATPTDDGRVTFSYDLLLRATSLLRFTEEQVLAFLERIEAPTRLVRPADGWPVDDATVERRTGAVSTLELETVEGGHHVHLERPGAIAEIVGEFL